MGKRLKIFKPLLSLGREAQEGKVLVKLLRLGGKIPLFRKKIWGLEKKGG